MSIQQSLDKYFCVPIEIAPRAFTALQGTFWSQPLRQGGPSFVSSEAVLEALLQSSPACLSVLCDAGIPVQCLFPKRPYVDDTSKPGKLLHESLDNIFYGESLLHGIHTSPCAVYDTIKQSRYLSDKDLLHAFVQTAYRGGAEFDEYISPSKIRACVNDLGDRLLRSGFIKTHEILEEMDPGSGNYRATSVAAQKLLELQKKVDAISIADPSHDLYQLAIWQESGGKVRVRAFGAAGLGRTQDEHTREERSYVCRTNLFQPSSRTVFTDDAVAQLEEMINMGGCPEAQYQQFFTQHPEFLTGIDYTRVHPQLALLSQNEPTRIPDFMLEIMSSKFCDLLELKLPHEDLVRRLRSKGRVQFRAFVCEAIAQLREYQRYFENPQNREAFHAQYGLDAYRPSMVLVCGRRHHFRSDLERRELRELLPNDLKLWTYDDILERARRFRSLTHR